MMIVSKQRYSFFEAIYELLRLLIGVWVERKDQKGAEIIE